MKLKKIIACLLCAGMLSSCTGNTPDATTTTAAETTPAVTTQPENTNTAISGEIRDISSMELISELTAGWNLGNTLDATGGSGLSSETSWGNPETTKEMMDTVKAAGFNIIRIPTTWARHLDDENNIDPEWMDRVQEIVDFTIDENTYVIINLHHEEWNNTFIEKKDATVEKMKKVWSQIAERFKDYDEHLIFEGQNEPRKKGTDLEWSGGDEECWEFVNATNMAFVETVRNSGGNNAKRHLMIPGYCATSDPIGPKMIQLPENDDKIIVSVHAYTPYGFALSDTPSSKFSSKRKNATRDIDSLAEMLETSYINNNIAVIIGETGARNKDNLESRVDWAGYYTARMRKSGITCIWWDNGSVKGNGENFGLLDRRTCTWHFPEVRDAFIKGAKGEIDIENLTADNAA